MKEEDNYIIKFAKADNYLFENLLNETLYFNNVSNFNDPFEGIFRYTIPEDEEEFKDFYLHYYNGNPSLLQYYLSNPKEFEKKLNEFFEHKFDNNAVCCFSKYINKTDIHMWAHYGNSFNGVCLIFNVNKLKFCGYIEDGTLIGYPEGPIDVDYIPEYPNENPLKNKLSYKNFLTMKFEKWIGENEVRYIAPLKRTYRFNKEALVGIIFGNRINISTKKAIKSIIMNNYNDVKFFSVSLAKKDFKINIVEETE